MNKDVILDDIRGHIVIATNEALEIPSLNLMTIKDLETLLYVLNQYYDKMKR
jgi:hypothetical protein